MPATYGRILSIDDESILRESIVTYLEDSGFTVYQAENGEKGLESFRENKPDLVLSDIQMPGMSGLDVLSAISKESPDTPVIMVSGAGGMDDAIEALRLGAWDYIVKPIVDMTVLEHSVCKALERARLIFENKAYRKELEKKNLSLSESLTKLEEDQQAGRTVQILLLPEQKFIHEPYVFQHQVVPSLYLSGDFVDYFVIDKDRIGFYIADVSGHGSSSAFVTVLLQSLVGQYLAQNSSGHESPILYPDRVLKKISDEIFTIKLGKYLTMFYGVIDTKLNTLTYSIGGHYPSPILFDGQKAHFMKGEGFAVGIFDKAEYQCYNITLPDAFTLTMFSDGIMELIKGDNLEEQETKILQCLSKHIYTPSEVFEVLEVDISQSLPDDITLFTINRSLE